MFEIILLIVATGGIASFARARGGRPWLWGTFTMAGYFLVPFLVVFFAAMFGADPKALREDSQLWFFVSAVTGVAVLGFCARFLLGRNYAKPDGMWSWSNCKYLNQPYAVLSEACKQPYASKGLPCS
jgi:hypothetical protein